MRWPYSIGQLLFQKSSSYTGQVLLEGWQGVFRHVILSLMPVDVVAGAFSAELGRPTKELYSMAGLLVLKELMDWDKEEALNAYRFRLDVHYALNLSPTSHDLAIRTLERYEKIFIENDLENVSDFLDNFGFLRQALEVIFQFLF